MPRVDRPAIRANVSREPLRLLNLFRAVMALGAKALQLAIPKLERVAAVRVLVIGDGPGPGLPHHRALRTKGKVAELARAALIPSAGRIPLPPRMGLSAALVGSSVLVDAPIHSAAWSA